MAYKKMLNQLGQLGGWLVAVQWASLYKISFIIGSTATFFSGMSLVAPLIGATGNVGICWALFMLRVVVHYLIAGTLSYGWLAYCVPGLCAALAWARPHFMMRFLVPLVCMALFIAHPQGTSAWTYTLYWLVPVVLFLAKQRSVFTHALASTFVAHAVGSVIWQYTTPMTTAAWLLLVPIVAVERVLFASGMTVLYYLGSYIRAHGRGWLVAVRAFSATRSRKA